MNAEALIREYCKHLRKVNLQTLQYDWTSRSLFWDLPKVAVICYNGDKCEKGYSHSYRGVKWYFPLRNELAKAGGVGNVPKNAGHAPKIGSCAEQHAANAMFKYHKAKYMDDLCFSTALRPKTLEPVEYCNNCKKIFNI